MGPFRPRCRAVLRKNPLALHFVGKVSLLRQSGLFCSSCVIRTRESQAKARPNSFLRLVAVVGLPRNSGARLPSGWWTRPFALNFRERSPPHENANPTLDDCLAWPDVLWPRDAARGCRLLPPLLRLLLLQTLLLQMLLVHLLLAVQCLHAILLRPNVLHRMLPDAVLRLPALLPALLPAELRLPERF